MRSLSVFLAHISGSAIEKFAVSAAVITVAGISSANFLSKVALNPNGSAVIARNEKLMTFEAQRADSSRLAGLGSLNPVGNEPRFNNVDATPLASVGMVNGRPIILDPCTGKTK